MKVFYFFVGAFVLAFGFVSGIYYQNSGPEPRREIASQKVAVKNDGRTSTAIQDCMQDSFKDGKVDLSRSKVDKKNLASLSMDCVGEKARDLYETVAPYAVEEYIQYSDGRKGIGRFFGRAYPPSQCVRLTSNTRGEKLDRYSCSIQVDLTQELIRSIKL